MRIELIFGFLGSGKTTLARRILEQWGPKERLALIVNEFGDVGVDGQILEGNGIDLIELSSGCLCCTLRGSLLNAIEELARRQPLDHIVIEATGVAEPDELVQTFSDPSFNARYEIGPMTTVVDVAKFSKIRTILGPFYEGQIIQADILVLNKVDLADGATVELVRSEVRQLNESAMLRFAERCDIDIAEIMRGPASAVMGQSREARHEKASHDHGDHAHGHDHHGPRHAPADSFVVEMPASVDRAALEAFYARAPEGLWRSKGYVRVNGAPALVQYALSGLEITPASDRQRYYLVMIGSGLDRTAIAAELARVAREATAA
jgi:G3E family GTPase